MGMPVGVLPKKKKEKVVVEEKENKGKQRPKEETPEDKKARKQQIKEEKKVLISERHDIDLIAKSREKEEIEGSFQVGGNVPVKDYEGEPASIYKSVTINYFYI